MTDPIDSVRHSNATANTDRVTAAKRVGTVKRDHEGDFVFEDRIDVAPEEHLSNAPDIIDLSLEMIRALIANELPEEAVTALESFASLGDLVDGAENCDRVQSKGLDFISWEKTQTLSQALAFAAS
jgi:hypothetical protein